MTNICIAGSCGKMGRRIAALACKDPEVKILKLLESPDCQYAGKPFKEIVPGCDIDVEVTSDLSEAVSGADCLIDFTLPEPTLAHLEECAKHSVPMVIGTTGFNDSEIERIRLASEKIPIVFAPNMAPGITLLFNMISGISAIMGKDSGIKIKETHHVHKKDSPSGTARKMAECVGSGCGKSPEIEAFREGEVVGEHEICFDGEFERIEIRHSAKDRDVFASGAIRAAKFIKDRPAGLYGMPEVLGL